MPGWETIFKATFIIGFVLIVLCAVFDLAASFYKDLKNK